VTAITREYLDALGERSALALNNPNGQQYDAAVLLASDLPAVVAALRGVLDLHKPMRIYDECECADPVVGVDGHVDIEEVGITCHLLYVACQECCVESREWPEQAEWCHDRHDHEANGQCPTLDALAGTQTDAEVICEHPLSQLTDGTATCASCGWEWTP